MLCKNDMEKAYGHVYCLFLDLVMDTMGFG